MIFLQGLSQSVREGGVASRPPVNQTSGPIGESERRAPNRPTQGPQGQAATLRATPERTVFAQYWPFRADSRVDGSQPQGAGFRWKGYGSSDRTRAGVNGRVHRNYRKCIRMDSRSECRQHRVVRGIRTMDQSAVMRPQRAAPQSRWSHRPNRSGR